MLDDLLLEVLGGNWTSTNRGLLLFFTIPASVLASMTGWLIARSAAPLNETLGLEAFAGSVVIGSAGVLWAILHLIREPADRFLAVLCLVMNAAAVSTPVMWLVA